MRALCAATIGIAISVLESSAQYAHLSTVHDGFGQRSTGGPYTQLSSGAQPGGIRISSGGSAANFAGYLQTFAMQPAKDTDGDGMPDGLEALSGTNPTNLNALLKIIAISNAPTGRAVAWLARGNSEKVYVVKARTNMISSAQVVVFSNPVAGGTAPWYETTNAVTDTTAMDTEFFHVEVLP